MGKRSQRRPVRYERDQSGCMWGIISILDFRQGRSHPKLLSDRKRGSRHAVVSGTTKNKFDLLNNLDENSQGTIDVEDNTTKAVDAVKPSVKKLIEEDMVGERGVKERKKGEEVEPIESNSEHGGHKRKNRRKKNRSRSKSGDAQIEILDVGEDKKPERSHIHNSEKELTENLDIDKIMEEFCQQIHQKSISCLKHDWNGEVRDQPNLKNPDFEEKLSEAIKNFIRHKLINGKHVTGDGNITSSKELKDALQILSSDEELFLKLLQDPESVMMKCIQSLWENQGEKDEVSKQLIGSNIPEQEFPDVQQPDESIRNKQRKFFRRKAKSLEKNQSKEIKSSEALNRIVILKPGPTGSQNPETKSNHCSSPESQVVLRDKGANDRVGSHFFLAEIRRRWKHAMGKERQEISNDSASKRFSIKHRATGNSDKGFKENAGRNSPSKDHFFIEKIAKPPMGVKKKEKSRKPKEGEISMQHEFTIPPKQRVSNIYIEARKHLSELLSNGPEDMDFSSRQVPKTLGKILSLSEYNSPINSPNSDWGQSFVTAQMRYSGKEKFHEEENNVSNLSQTIVNLEAQSCISDDSIIDKAEAAPSKPIVPNEVVDKEETTFSSIQEEMLSEGDVAVVKTCEIVVQEDINILDSSFEPSKSCIVIEDGRNVDVIDVSDGPECSEPMKQDSSLENHFSPSPLTSSVSKNVEDPGSATEMPERPSPVSVLDPLFVEEDISPARTRSQPVERAMQPLRIQFEEHDPAAADECFHSKTGNDDKESINRYVKSILEASGMNRDEFYMRSSSSNQLLDSSKCDEVEFFPSHLCHDKKLLFDCINEVLMELYGRCWGCYLGLSFIKRTIRPLPNMEHAVREVLIGVYWHLLPLPLPSTLDQIINKDMAKTGAWMDLQLDAATIIVEIGEAIFEDLMEDTVLSYASSES